MTDAKRIPRDDIPPMPGKVIRDGGDLRLLEGSDHDLRISVMHSQVVPGSGPDRHRHPHTELFVIEGGTGRFEIDGATFDAQPGDMLIIPSNAWHGFSNTGDVPLRLVAVHESPRATTEWEDGRRRS